MKKIFITLQLVLTVGIITVKAQNLYTLGGTWIDLDNMTKQDTPPANADSADFKKLSKYANRFNVVSLTGEVPKSTFYKNRPFRIIDDGHIGYKVSAIGKEVSVETNKEDEKLDDVPGNDFIVTIPDGIVHVQRFEGKSGYRISRLDEWGKTKFRQNLPHTLFTPVKDKDDFKTPYLFYFTHTDRFMAFTSLNARSIRKTIIIDLKDGKALPIESTICGVIRAENELAFKGYLIRDEVAKTVKVSMAGSNWSLKDNNITKLVVESLIVNDSVLVLARYHQSGAGISLIAFNSKTGKPVWSGEVKQVATVPGGIFLSMYKNRLMMEVVQSGNNYMEAFDITTGKRVYTSI